MSFILFHTNPAGEIRAVQESDVNIYEGEELLSGYYIAESPTYNFDNTNSLNLTLSADKTEVVLRHSGKTDEELKTIFAEETKQQVIADKVRIAMVAIKRQVWEILEGVKWREERAEELDFLNGNTEKTTALAVYRKAVRDRNNEVEAELQALVDAGITEEQIDAFNSDWKTQFREDNPINF